MYTFSRSTSCLFNFQPKSLSAKFYDLLSISDFMMFTSSIVFLSFISLVELAKTLGIDEKIIYGYNTKRPTTPYKRPTTKLPTFTPSTAPTVSLTKQPFSKPTNLPTTFIPSFEPTVSPTTTVPTTTFPSIVPTIASTFNNGSEQNLTELPTFSPTTIPTPEQKCPHAPYPKPACPQCCTTVTTTTTTTTSCCPDIYSNCSSHEQW